MNIFILSLITKQCARYHCDKHVVKMIIELAQLLCSAHIILDNATSIEDVALYKLTHKNHPCAIWVRSNSGNYRWTYDLFYDLCEEYTHRFSKTHLCMTKLADVLAFVPRNINASEMTEFIKAMPDEYKTDNVVESYRNYYKFEKKGFCKWTRREIPEWFLN